MPPTVGVLFGGVSEEHSVSCASARAIIEALRQAGFDPMPIGINKDARWYLGEPAWPLLDGRAVDHGISPEAAVAEIRRLGVEVIFPITHGRGGEDGVLQGFLDVCGLPYVGSGVLSSAASMDKVLQKFACQAAGIPVTRFFWGGRSETALEKIEAAARTLNPPFFVKPSNQGSSVGITRVENIKDLKAAIELALKHDERYIVEEGVIEMRELELGILETKTGLVTSTIGEIKPRAAFYDYDSKYGETGADFEIPAKLDPAVDIKIQDIAKKAWRLLNCRDLARFDFFLEKNGQPILNEVNTLPGFTKISLYSRLFAASGLDFPTLVRALVENAESRNQPARTFALA